MVLCGKISEVLSNLGKKMKEYSKHKEFEKAIEIRAQINAIEWLKEKQKVQRDKKYGEDVINFVVKDDKMYLILFNVNKGILENKQSYVFDYDPNSFEEFLLQYYAQKDVPKELIVSIDISSSLKKVLSGKKKVVFTVPKIGDKKKLLDLVKKNIELLFFKQEEALVDLKKELRLMRIPSVIECFDISHLSGTFTVGSMVQFRNAVPDKTNYRRFKIRTVEGIDDVSSIAEVVKRRYRRLKNENSPMPDLIVIDGGKGQLMSAFSQLKALELKIPIISLAKKFEDVYVPGLRVPLKINKKGKTLKLLAQIRDEAHRFAITYNRLLRKKSIKND